MTEGNRIGTLKHGLKVGDQVEKEFEIRAGTSADYFNAEASADSSKPISFRAALVAQQLVRIGSFQGPFTLTMLGKLKPSDLNTLMDARDALEAEGEAEQHG